jgi:NAD(P)-dependent dehydrogenase (short-subunit alcohol dehydrogenase family)
MTIRFDDRVAIVTGAGGGLGRQHALALGRRGCKVVVNDFGGGRDGTGGSATPAEQVAAEIIAAGGEAIAAACSVTDVDGVQAMVQSAMDTWGRVDILVNNAGVLRDKTFAKMELDDFRFVLEVHLMGAVICSKAVWEIMRAQTYGRIAMTTSSSGLYGNFGQSNYAAAKMGLVGLMQTLAIEGAKYDIRVNSLAPTAATRMTEDLGGALDLDAIRPDLVSAGPAASGQRECPEPRHPVRRGGWLRGRPCHPDARDLRRWLPTPLNGSPPTGPRSRIPKARSFPRVAPPRGCLK